MKSLIFAMLLALAVAAHAHPTPPASGKIKVAFVISESANLMDIAGPWEVFQDTMLDDGKDTMPFELYTVAPDRAPLHATGGMTITPDYTFDDAPRPDIVVVGAQSGGPGLTEWLTRQHADRKIVMSVCTGAFKLAKAGLLDGKPATTHHWYFGNMADQYPQVKLVREVRYVQSDATTYTAGGLTSGVDLSLHLVAAYFGDAQAQRTADYMEYQGRGWKTNEGTAELTTPVKQQRWTGKIGGDEDIVLHVLTTGASNRYTIDIPAQQVAGVQTAVKSDGPNVSFSLPIGGRDASFAGAAEPGSTAIKGSFTQDGKVSPLTLTFNATP